MKRFFCVCLALMIAVIGVSCNSSGEEAMFPLKQEMKTDGQLYQEGEVLFPSSLWETPFAEEYPELNYEEENIKSYFIDSIQDTKVFVFVGIPQTASAENKVPGIVLVHGGNGTAYYEWVNYWVQRGYAAIAMDTEGNMPLDTSLMTNDFRKESIRKHGPSNSALTDMNAPVEQQWAYHAIASIIVSNSFLRSFDCVDVNHIGISGISYGAFLTCQAVAYDDRYVFAAPVYGSLEQKIGKTTFSSLVQGKAGQLWDDIDILQENETPFLFLNGNKDYWFSIESTTKCQKSTKYSLMSLKNSFVHGQPQGALEVPEVYAFADYFCYGKQALLKITEQPKPGKAELKVQVPNKIDIKEVIGYYTTDDILDMNTEWKTVSGTEKNGVCTADIPKSAIYFYLSVIDDRGLEISSNVISVK